MINLLPPQEVETNNRERNKNLLLVLGNVVLTSTLCLILVLLSVRFSLLAELSSHQSVLEQARAEHASSQFSFSKEEVREQGNAFRIMDQFYTSQVLMHRLLEDVIAIPRSEGLRFSHISIQRRPAGDLEIVLAGSSPTRNSLLAFKSALEKGEGVQSVSFPAESWVQKQDIRFQATIIRTLP